MRWYLLASGPSMNQADAELVRGRGTVIAINNTVQLAPWADYLYSCDPQWWIEYPELWRGFRGRKLGLNHPSMPPGVERLDYDQFAPGLGLDKIHCGHNSGYQTINYAYLHGAREIVLVGYDMSAAGTHWHAPHKAPLGNWGCPSLCIPKFTQLAADLQAQGVRVINASRQTQLTCFERAELEAL